MKRLLSVFLLVIFLLSQLVVLAFAEEPQNENEITNIAPLGVAYCTSEKNSLWTPVKSMINGKYGGVDGEWQGWECAYPEVKAGQDTSAGFAGEFCGVKFENDYYEIHKIKMNIGLHILSGGQNATYTIQALVDGKWEQVAVLKDDQAVPTSSKYADYDAVMSDSSASHRVNATLYYTLEAPITTNNIRIVVSDYAKNYEGGDVLIFPFIYELELFGKKGKAPEIILPEGASVSTDVAWYSYPSAKAGDNGTYPFLAIDGREDTYWEIENYEGGEYFTLYFDNEYEIGSVNMVFERPDDKKIQSTTLEYYIDGEWNQFDGIFPKLGTASEGHYAINYEFPATLASAVRVKLSRATSLLRFNTFEAHLKDSKTYSFDSRFSAEQLASISKGNLAIIGSSYSSASFDPYSDNSYINDGLSVNSKVWFTGTLNTPEHCGISFDYSQKISKAVVTVRPSRVIGREVMKFEIQALVNGEYVTLTTGCSYDGDYKTEYTFDEVETTDIRIVIKEANGAIPNVMELELYNSESTVQDMFSGIKPIIADTPEQDDPSTNLPTDSNDEADSNEESDNFEQEKEAFEAWYLIPIITAVIISLLAIIIAKKNSKQQNICVEPRVKKSSKEENRVKLMLDSSEGKRHILKKKQ